MFNREEYIINMIKDMNINDKLRLGVAMFSSSFINTNYNKKEMFEKMDSKLKKIDSTYVTKFTKEKKNRIAMYLVNSI